VSCSECLCRDCMLWWSSRCPYGDCWDDYRAKVEPFPGQERRFWTNWNKPGEQAHWCRGGFSYPIADCPNYVKYQTPIIQFCLGENVQKWADGYIQCGLIDTQGCKKCWERWSKAEELKGEDR